jgi:hypothetical protein
LGVTARAARGQGMGMTMGVGHDALGIMARVASGNRWRGFRSARLTEATPGRGIRAYRRPIR